LLAILAGQMEPDSGELACGTGPAPLTCRQDSRFGFRTEPAAGFGKARWLAGGVPEDEREGRLRELQGAPVSTAWTPRPPRFPAAGASGWRLWRRWSAIRMCCCWTSPPTIWIFGGIEWLEEMLTGSSFAAVTVSHDVIFWNPLRAKSSS